MNITLKSTAAIVGALLLTACGTTVPLNVETPAPVALPPASGSTGAASHSAPATLPAAPTTQKPAAVDLSQNTPPAKNASGLPGVIYFDFDSFSIRPEYAQLIAQHAQFLTSKGLKVMVEGHADERGTREYNLSLGQERAEAVRRALSVLSVKEEQIEAISFGEEKPAVAESNEEAWSKNRRVELRY